MKINFTEQHAARLQQLALEMLFTNSTVSTPMGQRLGISELIHTTTINTLNDVKNFLTKGIEKKEAADEWGQTDHEQRELQILKGKRELVNLLIGYKRKIAEQKEAAEKKAELNAQLKALKEDLKTPEDRIKELEAEIAGLGD